MGADSSLNETNVQLPDGAMRMKASVIRERFKEGGALQDSVLKFIRLLMLQISQTALCNRLHTVEERLARWLLLCHDRATSDELKLTQEFLSIMLGTNRATVTVAAIALQGGGYIKYVRGLITVLDREGLEHFSCDCYRTVKEEYDRVRK
jgi:CRP-like cAMP-binding protein